MIVKLWLKKAMIAGMILTGVMVYTARSVASAGVKKMSVNPAVMEANANLASSLGLLIPVFLFLIIILYIAYIKLPNDESDKK